MSILKKIELKSTIDNFLKWLKNTYNKNPIILILYLIIFITPFIISFKSFSYLNIISIFIGFILVALFYKYITKTESNINKNVDLNINDILNYIHNYKKYDERTFNMFIKYVNLFFKLYNKLSNKEISCLRKLKYPLVFQKGYKKLIIDIPIENKAKRILNKILFYLDSFIKYLPNDRYLLKVIYKHRNTIQNILYDYLTKIHNLCLDEIKLNKEYILHNESNIDNTTSVDYVNQMKFEKY